MNRRSFLTGAVLSPVVAKLPRPPQTKMVIVGLAGWLPERPWWDGPDTRAAQQAIEKIAERAMREASVRAAATDDYRALLGLTA